MLKSVFINHLKEEIYHSSYNYNNDIPAINMLFNDTKDMLHKDGHITDSQVNNWILTNRELNSLLNTAKGK